MWRPLLLLLVTTGVVRGATDGNGQPRARQYTLPSLYSSSSSSPQQLSQYPGDLQYDLSALSSPQLQYPGGPQPSLHGYPPAFYPGNPNARIPSQQPGSGPVLIYPSSAGGGGQPFLLGGGGLPPPGNFLIPQQPPQQPPPLGPGLDPGLIYRDAPPYHPHQRPVFVAGYPKPAHIPPPPPIEKDAEEVPASVDRGSGPPAQGAPPPQGGLPRLPPPPQGKKPQKIETFDEPIRPEKPSDEQPIPKKSTRQRPKLNPGQRFFILNGQPLFANYPISPFFNPYHQQQGGIPDFYKNQQQQPQFPPGFGLFGKPQQHQEYPIQGQYPAYDTNQNAFKQNIFFKNGLPLGLLKQIRANQLNNRVHPQSSSNNDNNPSNGDGPLQSREYDQQQQQRQRHPAQQQQLQLLQQQQQQQYDNLELEELDEALQFDRQRQSPYNDGQINPGVAAYDYFRYQAPAVPVKLPLKVADVGDEDDDDKDSVEIVAKVQDDKDEDSESEDVVAAVVSSEKPTVVEASIAQAQPGAIALAGVGGVAAAGPRGTALAGEGGLAVASPQATAVAGPRNDDEDVSNNKRKPAKKISKQ